MQVGSQTLSDKASIEYLLNGKAFCGECGAHMVGECGRGHNGTTYYYYTCANRKKSHSCNKSNEKKDFIEWYVVEQTLQYVLTPSRIAYIAEYDKEFAGDKIDESEKAVKQLEFELNKLVDALIDAPKIAHKRIYEKMESLEAQKAALENDLIKLKIAHDIRFTEEEVRAWLKRFCTGDLFDPEFRRNIIETFINSVYLYDDRVIIFYNIKGGKQISKLELDTALSESKSSDSIANAPPHSVRKHSFRTDILYFSYKNRPSKAPNREKRRGFPLRFPRFFGFFGITVLR